MKRTVLKNLTLWGKQVDIAIENGKFVEIGKINEDGEDFGGKHIYPGPIDVHSHGCLGYEAISKEDHLLEMAEYMLSQGTTTWYPTTSTASEQLLAEVANRRLDYSTGAYMPGFHFEGPYINPKYKGAQDPLYIKTPNLEFIKSLPQVKRISIAPELPGSKNFIENCGILVSICHTDCDYETALGAFRAGATSLTHTYNAMPGIHHRAPGPIGAASDTEGVYAELISDGHHVHPSAIRILIKIMGTERVILISDSISAMGLPNGHYSSGGLEVDVKDGLCTLENGTIAGSTTPLLECMRRAVKFGCTVEEVFRMGSENPAKLMGLNKGRIEVGYDADFIITDENLNLIKAVVGCNM